MIDAVIIGILFFSGLFAWYRGFMRELLGITSWIVAGLSALYGAQYMVPYVEKLFDNPSLVSIVSAGLTALLVLIVFAFFNSFISNILHKSSLSGLDRMLGFMFGLIRGMLILSVMFFCVKLFMLEKDTKTWAKHSVLMPYVIQTTEFLEKYVPQQELQDLIEKRKEEAKEFEKEKEKHNSIKKQILKDLGHSKSDDEDDKEHEDDVQKEYNDDDKKALDDLFSEV